MNRREPLRAALLSRLRSQRDLKVFLFIALPTVLTVAYFTIQRTIIFPTRSMPLSWFDRAIPFQSGWVCVYVSLYLLNPIGPLFTRSRTDLFRYTRGILFLFVSGLFCFLLFPVAGPRPTGTQGPWLYDHLILVDRAYNSFPSLHAACAVYAVLYAAYASGDSSRPMLRKVFLGLAWLWVALILYSTVATRQHFAIDLPPGIFLAWLAQRIFLRRSHAEVISEQHALVGREAA